MTNPKKSNPKKSGRKKTNPKKDKKAVGWQSYEPYVTAGQLAALKAVAEHGKEAAVVLGVSKTALRSLVFRAKARAAKIGWDPTEGLTQGVPSGFGVKKLVSNYDSEGNLKTQWVTSIPGVEDEMAALVEVFTSEAVEFRGKSPLIKREITNTVPSEDLLPVYVMGDPHIGLYVWGEECGDDFDLNIAVSLMEEAVDTLVRASPSTETALIVNVGDFFHADNADAKTAKSGNSLDVDSRWAKVLRTGMHLMIHTIRRALERHTNVRVISAIGNHDVHSSVMLSLGLNLFFENNPRVTIDTHPGKFHWFEFGKVLLGVTHGDTVKAANLPGIMAHDVPEAWGRTQYRKWLCGHIHHKSAQEYPGVSVESFQTLAARDSWHSGAGYRSQRSMTCIVYHKDRGEITRNRFGVGSIPFEAATIKDSKGKKGSGKRKKKG